MTVVEGVSVPAVAHYRHRLNRIRRDMEASALEALVVTHPPNVRYLTGFTGSAGVVLLTPRDCTLVVDFRYATAARGVAGSGAQRLFELIVPPGNCDDGVVRGLEQSGARRIGIEAAWMPVARFNKLSGALAGTAPRPLLGDGRCPVLVPTERLVETLRMVKDAAEIATMREAGRRIAALVPDVLNRVQPGCSELELAGEVELLLRRAGFERPAFETIVASGPNSALPHARPTARRLRAGDLVVLDFGGVYDGYCVDLTRTVQLGEAPPECRHLFGAVSEAHRAATAAVRPGIRGSEVDAVARDVLARHGLAEAFGHATGHGLGLEVHEDPRLGRIVEGQPDVTLAPGMVFTIEPGAYVEGLGGVRIEDDVLVTEDGHEVLTGDREVLNAEC